MQEAEVSTAKKRPINQSNTVGSLDFDQSSMQDGKSFGLAQNVDQKQKQVQIENRENATDNTSFVSFQTAHEEKQTKQEDPDEFDLARNKKAGKERKRGCCGYLRFFCGYSCTDILRNKCTFCLAFSAVYIVVLSTLTVQSLVTEGPIIWLKIAQIVSGEADGYIVPVQSADVSFVPNLIGSEYGVALNYDEINSIYPGEFNLAPRMQFPENYGYATDADQNEIDLPMLKFLAFDTELEKQYGIGDKWSLDPLDPNECYVNANLQQVYNLTVGMTISITETYADLKSNIMMHQYNLQKDPDQLYVNDNQNVNFADYCVIKDFYFDKELQGKLPNANFDDYVIFEYKHFLKYAFNTQFSIHPPGQDFLTWYNSDPNINYKFADYLVYALPSPRISYYKQQTFSQVQRAVLGEQQKVLEALGTYPVVALNPVLSSLQIYQYGTIVVSVIFDVIILIFSLVSILLIYSLLMISVEEKRYDAGLMRMIGLTSTGYMCSILFQALLFVLPSVTLGYISSYASLYYLFKFMFNGNAAEYDVSFIPDWQATVFSVSLGFFIPMFSAIIPIKQALSRTLAESLNTKRGKTSGVKIKVTEGENNSSILIPGFAMVIFGTIVFYFLPYSLLHVDLGLILEIFLAVLFGMILGLVLIAFNFERLFEVLFVYLLFFWENKSMRTLCLKNLVAHKKRNELTAIIQSTTLASIIFLITMLNLELNYFTSTSEIGKINIQVHGGSISPANIDSVLQEYSDGIKEFVYTTNHMYSSSYSAYFQTEGLVTHYPKATIASTPSPILSQIVPPNQQNLTSGLNIAEQLYTPRGSQATGLEHSLVKYLLIESDTLQQTTQLIYIGAETPNPINYWTLIDQRVLFTFQKVDFEVIESYYSCNIISLPVFLYFKNSTVDSYGYENVFINLNDASDFDFAKRLSTALQIASKSSEVTNNVKNPNKEDDDTDGRYSKDQSTGQRIKNIVNLGFDMIITIVMLLCFFSLSANMSANLYEQSKEIGVLRAIGFRSLRIKLLYFYEALVLVLASSMQGIFIGMAVGYAFFLQQAIYMSTEEVPSFFPTEQVATVLVISIVCALFSTVGPATAILSRQISNIFRIN